MCKESFQFFAKGREELEEAALYSTVLHLYDQINCRIPRHVSPPTHEEVKKLLEIFDDNGDGVMDEDEFIDFSVFLFNQVRGNAPIDGPAPRGAVGAKVACDAARRRATFFAREGGLSLCDCLLTVASFGRLLPPRS